MTRREQRERLEKAATRWAVAAFRNGTALPNEIDKRMVQERKAYADFLDKLQRALPDEEKS